ncbi:MAG: hypothetical protein ACK55I_46215, partial [bacterium]
AARHAGHRRARRVRASQPTDPLVRRAQPAGAPARSAGGRAVGSRPPRRGAALPVPATRTCGRAPRGGTRVGPDARDPHVGIAARARR